MSLTESLRAEIAQSGPIPFRDFMARALYDPVHGYYASGRARIGRQGDYFTSVSVGPLYGALLARQFAEVWDILGRPQDFMLVEQGAHDGTLAADVLDSLPAEMPKRLTIVEPIAALRALQETKLTGRTVQWVNNIEHLEPFTGAHYSNELLDSFPIHILQPAPNGLKECAVDLEQDKFILTEIPLSNERLASLAEDVNTTEISLDARDWIAALAPKLIRGAVFVIDYGYTHSQLPEGGTLEAIANHRRVDPLFSPGEADLTAHVDFAAIARATNLDILGFTDQHHFLVALSRSYFVDGVPPTPRESRAFQTLAHPTMLGRAFKVLALGREIDRTLSGFAFARDARTSLGLP